MSRFAAVAFVGLALVACSQEAQEDDAAVAGDSAFTSRQLEDMRANDPTLKKLQAIATADVEQFEIDVDAVDTPTADAYGGISLESGYGTSGLDWFRTPNASYPDNKRWDQGSDTGKKCQWASIFRFEAIFSNPPAEAAETREASTWGGRFWSWTDDYAAADQEIQDPTASYAWSSGLWKWIASSGKGGKCRLPTRTQVAGMMKACTEQARANDRDAKGCRMPAHEEEP